MTAGRSSPGSSRSQYSGGGAIWNAASLSVERATITGNEAGYGGGVFNDPLSSASFVDSTISSNTAGEAGGVRCDSTCSFVNTTVRDNTVVDPGDPTRPGSLAGTGGGIDIRGVAPVSIVGSTIMGNRADYGGGINAAPGYLDTFPIPPVEQGTQVRLRGQHRQRRQLRPRPPERQPRLIRPPEPRPTTAR